MPSRPRYSPKATVATVGACLAIIWHVLAMRELGVGYFTRLQDPPLNAEHLLPIQRPRPGRNDRLSSVTGFAAPVRILWCLTSESVLTLRYRRTGGDGNENRRSGLLGVLRGDGWASAEQP